MKKPVNKKIIALLLAALLIIATAVAFALTQREKSADVQAEATSLSEITEPATVEAPEEEIISFEVTDNDSNVLTLIPIYDADAVTVIAGYVESAVDKNGTALTADTLSSIGSIVSVTAGENGFTLDLNEDKTPVIIEAYSDDAGNIVAFKDVKDLNKNNDKEEYLKLNLATDANGIKRYMVEYTAVTVTKKTDGTATATVDGKKLEVKEVNSGNTAVANKIAEDKKKNEAQNESNKQKEPSTESTTKAPVTEPTDNTSSTEAEEPQTEIVLLSNRNAKCDDSSVNITTGAVTITASGNYLVTSQTDVWHGQIIVKLPNTEKAEVQFKNVNIQNDTTNIIQIIDTSINEDRSFLEAESGLDDYADDYVEMLSEYDMAPNVQLSFPEGTSSSFTTTARSHTGVLYNESKLIIKGHGSAEFSSTRNPNNSICSTKSIKIRNVSLKLTTPQSESTSVLDKTSGSAKGIFSYSRVTVESGTINIKSNGDGVRCQKFEILDGKVNIASSACDGIDAEDMIVINGGSVNVTALEKSSFKVRRINNTEKGYIKGRMRPEKGDTFEINGGTVIGESKKISTVQPTSSQASITCRIVKPSRGTDAAALEVKVPAYISISGVKSSSNKCTKFLYSSSSVKSGTLYTASTGANSTTMVTDNTDNGWNGPVGSIMVVTE